MTFIEILNSSREELIGALMRRAALSNRLAKAAPTAAGRRRFYAQKSAALSRLVLLGAGRVDEVLLARGLVTVALGNGRRMHLPIRQLPIEVRRHLAAVFDQQVLAAS